MFRYKRPDPEVDNMIVIIGSDDDLCVFKWNSFTRKWMSVTSSPQAIPRIVFSDDKGFMSGELQWTYYKEFTRFMTLVMRNNIECEE